jgi:hypothetical protein
MKTFLTLGVILLASLSASYANAQDITRVSPNGKVTWTYDRTSQGLTVSREGPHLSWSRSVGFDQPSVSASASGTASSVSTNGKPAVAYVKVSTSAVIKPDGVDIAKARAVAKGQVTTTSATTKP